MGRTSICSVCIAVTSHWDIVVVVIEYGITELTFVFSLSEGSVCVPVVLEEEGTGCTSSCLISGVLAFCIVDCTHSDALGFVIIL